MVHWRPSITAADQPHGGNHYLVPMAASLTRVPLDLMSEWTSKIVTTNPPRYVPHPEWSLRLRVVAPTPVRSVVLFRLDREVVWGLVAAEPSPVSELRVDFRPHDWASSDAVHVLFEWQRVVVTHAALKVDPRSGVNVLVPATARTGDVIPVADLSAHALDLAMLVVAEPDTERRRMGRWRIKRRFAAGLPEDLIDLTNGEQTGHTGQTSPVRRRVRRTSALG